MEKMGSKLSTSEARKKITVAYKEKSVYTKIVNERIYDILKKAT